MRALEEIQFFLSATKSHLRNCRLHFHGLLLLKQPYKSRTYQPLYDVDSSVRHKHNKRVVEAAGRCFLFLFQKVMFSQPAPPTMSAAPCNVS